MLRYAPLVVITSLCLSPGCATLGLPEPAWPSWGSSNHQVGTAAWWKKHRSKAEFVPGKGHRVAGTPGFFDDQGRPIDARVVKQVRQEEETGLLRDIQLSGAVQEIKAQVGMGPDEQAARQAYADAEGLFRVENYSQAAKSLKTAIARWPDSKLEQDAMFLLAECYFFSEKYPEANDAYEALVQKYANTPHLDKLIRRQFEIAQYWEKHHQYRPHLPITPNIFDKKRPLFDTAGRAIKVYDNIRLNDPTGPLADDAVMATANAYFLRGRYRDADYYYDLLRNEYPRSEHQYEAHVLGLQCKLRKYGGPDYVGEPLEEAQKLSRQLRTQFAAELDDEQRRRLAEIDGRLNHQLALRVHRMAEYFDGKKEYGAARRYYADVVNEYPQTELAEAAKVRLVALAELPAVPTPPLESVVNLFPQNAERAAIAQVPLLGNQPPTQMASQDAPSGNDADANATQRR